MATKGNLEAPTRHPLDWQGKDFYNEESCFNELERIFDICHGCRRCVSLCGSFPTLFDLVDESSTMEVDGVDKKDYWKVVDQCFMCDLCYMTKCPYTPPHEWNLDFPHTMLRAKAIKFKKGDVGAAESFLASTDTHGSLAGIPIVVQAVNAVNQTKVARSLMESTLGVDQNAWLPSLATRKFRSSAEEATSVKVVDGAKTPGKVAIYATCYINYNEPGIGQDLIKILNHNQIPYALVDKEACCGMPKLELGDLESVKENKEKNYPNSPSGMPGVQTLLPVMLNHVNDGKLTLEQLMNSICENPIKIFGIKNKGFIKEGFDADFTIVDMNKTIEIKNENIESKCGWSPFDGLKFKGTPVSTIIAGQVKMRDGKILGDPEGKPLKF